MIPVDNFRDKDNSDHETTFENDKKDTDCISEDCLNKMNNNMYYQQEIQSINNDSNKENNDYGTTIGSQCEDLSIDMNKPFNIREACKGNCVVSENVDEAVGVCKTFENNTSADQNTDIIIINNNNEDNTCKDNSITIDGGYEKLFDANNYVENCSLSNQIINSGENTGSICSGMTITKNCDETSASTECCVKNTAISENCDKNTAILHENIPITEGCDLNNARMESCSDKINTSEIDADNDTNKINLEIPASDQKHDENTAKTKNCIEDTNINNSSDQQMKFSQTYQENISLQSNNGEINVIDSNEDSRHSNINPEEFVANNVQLYPLKILRVNIEKLVYYKCGNCPKAFLNVGDLTIHKNKHKERFLAHVLSSYVRVEQCNMLDKKFVCSYNNCTQRFPTKRELLLHKVKHIQQSVKHTRQKRTRICEDDKIEKHYKCEECGLRFVAESTLKAHAFVHQPFQHICYCGIGFYQLEDLKAHEKLVHSAKPQLENKEPPHKIPKLEPPERTEPIKVKFQFHKKKRIRGMLQLEVDIMQGQLSQSRNKKKQCEVQTPLQRQIDSMRQQLTFSSLDVEFQETFNKRFECPECKKEFQYKCEAKKHYRSVHRGERPYSCNVCGKGFSQAGALTIHLKRHLGVKQYPCHYCEKSFYDIGALKLHERTHTGYKPYKCKVCGTEFSDPSAFQRHMRIHTGDKKYKCPYCPNAFTDNSQLYVHKKRHEGNRKFTCDKCHKNFYTKSDLKKHVSTVHNYVYNFTCKHCNKAFSTKCNMQRHIDKRHNSLRKTYNCHICLKTLLEPEYLERHIKLVHQREKPFVCEHCPLAFAFNSLLKRHIMVVHNKVKKFECDHCGSHFGFKADVFKHMLQYHSKIKCDYCFKHFSSRSELKEHILKVAEQCEICDGEFLCKRSLWLHFQTHMKKDPAKFVCDHCGFECSWRSSFIRHMLQYHAPRKYECDHCKQRFCHKDSLRSHIRYYHLDTLRCDICIKN